MQESPKDTKGYVYILEVKDIDLPVCKIGMTTRTPHERCSEINKNSTGDFIWSVAHHVAVDKSRELEYLVHSKLAPLRQKGREFFNIDADTAHRALLSILRNHPEIKELDTEEAMPLKAATPPRGTAKKHNKFRRIDSQYAELLQLFTSILNVKGRPFGQLNKPFFGISDGREGVQWNLAVWTDTDTIRLGVNLEGKKYRDWPIAEFILSELGDPRISQITGSIEHPENIFVTFSRDAWQVTSRPDIIEKHIGGKEPSLAELDESQWLGILREALECLNKENNYRGRSKQTVTLAGKPRNGERVRVMEVSPHLTIWSPVKLDGNIKTKLEDKMAELQPVYDWIKAVSKA